MSSFQDRRLQPRASVSSRGVLIADGRELSCVITDVSDGGLRLRLDRAAPLPGAVLIVDVTRALAFEGALAWQKGIEAGLKLGQGTSVRGLVPSRLLSAREAWVRASGV